MDKIFLDIVAKISVSWIVKPHYNYFILGAPDLKLADSWSDQ